MPQLQKVPCRARLWLQLGLKGRCVDRGSMWHQGEKPSPPALEITSLFLSFPPAAGGNEDNGSLSHCVSWIPGVTSSPLNLHLALCSVAIPTLLWSTTSSPTSLPREVRRSRGAAGNASSTSAKRNSSSDIAL